MYIVYLCEVSSDHLSVSVSCSGDYYKAMTITNSHPDLPKMTKVRFAAHFCISQKSLQMVGKTSTLDAPNLMLKSYEWWRPVGYAREPRPRPLGSIANGVPSRRRASLRMMGTEDWSQGENSTTWDCWRAPANMEPMEPNKIGQVW